MKNKTGLSKFITILTSCITISIQASSPDILWFNTTAVELQGLSSSRHAVEPSRVAILKSTHELLQDKTQRLFLDTRLKIDLSDNTYFNEINLGLAQRISLETSQPSLIGLYGFWDCTHTRNEVFLNQGTLGLEWQTSNWYVNINSYIPLSKFTTKVVGLSGSLQNRMVDRNKFMREQQGYLLTTNSLGGLDINFSRYWELSSHHTIAMTGLYKRFTDNTSVITGPGLELSITKASRYHSSTFSTSINHDDYHGTTSGLRAEIRWNPTRSSPQKTILQLYERPILRDTNVIFAEYHFPVDEKPYLFVQELGFNGGTPHFDELFFLRQLAEKFTIVQVYDARNYMVDLLLSSEYHNNTPEDTEMLIRHPAPAKIHWTSEVFIGHPKMLLDSYDLVLAFDYIEHPHYSRLPYQYIFHNNLYSTEFKRRQASCEPQKKHFACLLTSNDGMWGWVDKFIGAHDRLKIMDKLNQYKPVISGGKVRNNNPGPVYKRDGLVGPHVTAFRDTNMEWISDCKFMIALENSYYPGYMTEKPFQAWAGGAVPIYNLASDVQANNEINPNAIINTLEHPDNPQADVYDYDLDAVVTRVIDLDQDDDAYCKIWEEPYLTNPEYSFENVTAQLEQRVLNIIQDKVVWK